MLLPPSILSLCCWLFCAQQQGNSNHFSSSISPTGDLSYVLKQGDRLTVEVTEMSAGKERKRNYTKMDAGILEKLNHAQPKFYVNLAYVGMRPKEVIRRFSVAQLNAFRLHVFVYFFQAACCPLRPLTGDEVDSTANMKLWLKKRSLTCGFFAGLINGLAPPKPPLEVQPDEAVTLEKNSFSLASANNPTTASAASASKQTNATPPLVGKFNQLPTSITTTSTSSSFLCFVRRSRQSSKEGCGGDPDPDGYSDTSRYVVHFSRGRQGQEHHSERGRPSAGLVHFEDPWQGCDAPKLQIHR